MEVHTLELGKCLIDKQAGSYCAEDSYYSPNSLKNNNKLSPGSHVNFNTPTKYQAKMKDCGKSLVYSVNIF